MPADLNISHLSDVSRQVASQQPEASARPNAALAEPVSVEKIDPVEAAETVKESVKMTHEKTVEMMEKISQNLNAISQEMDRSLAFAVEEDIDRVVIVVSNPETGEEIRKLPSDTALKVAKSIETLKGILFDESV